MRYPDHKTYRKLYLRYLHSEGISELLQLLLPLQGMNVLDLCSGEGQVTSRALAAHVASVTMVDQEAGMIPEFFKGHQNVRIVCEDVYTALVLSSGGRELFDRVVCRQAVNYWLTEQTADLVSAVLRKGGVFVFNTFNEKPSTTPRIREYVLEEKSFVEVSWCIDDIVHHVQVREGMEPHTTSFRWISPESFRKMLEPCFEVTEHVRGKASLYRCVKR